MPIVKITNSMSQAPSSVFETIYDIRDFRVDVIDFAPLIFVFIGIGVFIYSKRYSDKNKIGRYGLDERSGGMLFGVLFSTAAAIMFVTLIVGSFARKHNFEEMLESGQSKTIEGVVNNFDPMPGDGHGDESFYVNGIYFNYSNFAVTGAYNKTASVGGQIKNGIRVQITYVNSTYIDPDDTHNILILKIAR